MDKNYHVIMLNLELPLILILFCLSTLSNVGAQSLCPGSRITIKDPVTGAFQCQDCPKCPSGEGSSVPCGAVISSKTPLVCKSCVLGETFSSAYEAGACKDCRNCGDYRETTKNCTLSSKTECGKCKPGAYLEAMLLGMCKPCSPCCNDGNDIIVPECKAPGVATNMQCSFLRSVKCRQMAAKAIVSTAIPTLQPNQSKVPITTSSTVTSAITNSYPSEPVAKQAYGASPPWRVITGSVVGGVFIVFILPLVITYCYFMAKRKRACKKEIDLACAEKEIGETLERVQGNDQANENKTDEQNPAAPVQESGESQERTGPTQETQLPGYHSNTDFKLPRTVLKPHPEPVSGLHSHTNDTAKKTIAVTVCVTSSDESTMV